MTTKRPCTCNRVYSPHYTYDQCRVCWLAQYDARYQELWGIQTQTVILPGLGDLVESAIKPLVTVVEKLTGKKRSCSSCAARKKALNQCSHSAYSFLQRILPRSRIIRKGLSWGLVAALALAGGVIGGYLTDRLERPFSTSGRVLTNPPDLKPPPPVEGSRPLRVY